MGCFVVPGAQLWFGRSQATIHGRGEQQKHLLERVKTREFQLIQLGGGFKYFLFLPLPGEMIQFD